MKEFLKKKVSKIRLDFFKLIKEGLKYHIGGSLSCIDLLVCLFYKKNFIYKKKFIFLLSKGHALGIFNAILIDKKIIKKEFFLNQFKNNSVGGQLDIFNSGSVDWNTGSLGHSIGIAIGMSISNPKKKIITLIGDAEIDEGSIWEALFYLSEKKISNIIIIIDRNKQSASKNIDYKEIFDKNFFSKLSINTYSINGHNIDEINSCYNKVLTNNKSAIIIANTVKGHGIKFFENNLKYSHNLPNNNLLEKIIKNYENQ